MAYDADGLQRVGRAGDVRVATFGLSQLYVESARRVGPHRPDTLAILEDLAEFEVQ